MSSRELVQQALEFAAPARAPRQTWTIRWTEQNHPAELAAIQARFPDDVTWSPALLAEPLQTKGDPYEVGFYTDEWGCTFENRQRGIIGEVKEPLLKTWDNLDRLRIPVERLSVDVERVNAFCRASDRFILAGTGPRPFEQMQFIRGTENVFLDLAEDRSEFTALLARLHEFYLAELDVWARTEVDGLFFQDDWGSQQSLLISPKTWRRLFKPLYRDYIALAHRYGKKVFMHSDGNIAAIYPDLVEIGLDAVNSQLFCMDIEKLGREYAGKITFWGEIDRQYLLPFGTRAEIVAAVTRVKQTLYCHGGVIAQCAFDVGAKPENVMQVFETWEKLWQ
jgi:hypothetical protein